MNANNLNKIHKICPYVYIYIYIYLLTASGLPASGSCTIHIYMQTIHSTTQSFGRVWAVPRLGELYPGICLTTEEKARKNFSQCSRKIRIHKPNNENT
jgi:uncharacterized integral membrane protein